MRRANGKIVTLARARAMAEAWRAQGARMVLASGVFELLEVGHVRSLARARALGSALVVGVYSDAAAASRLGPGRPVVSAHDRAAVVASLAAVALVVVCEESGAGGLIEALRPDVHATGADGGPAAGTGEEKAAAPGAVRTLNVGAERRPGDAPFERVRARHAAGPGGTRGGTGERRP